MTYLFGAFRNRGTLSDDDRNRLQKLISDPQFQADLAADLEDVRKQAALLDRSRRVSPEVMNYTVR